MSKDNKLHKYLAFDKQVRVITVFSTDVVNEYAKNKTMTPVVLATMGRLLTATVMMGSTLKGNETIMVSFNGNGPIGTIAAESDAFGHVRGFATNLDVNVPLNEYGNLNVGAAVGVDGYIQVRKQLNMKEPFVGTCELISGEIAEDISYYYGTSEQTPTIVALGVLANPDGTCKQSGGFIIQLLPNASEEAYSYLETMLKEIKSVSDLISSCASSSELVGKLFKDAIELFDYDVEYKCSCNKEKTKIMLTQLELSELEDEIKKGKGLDVTCNFCQQVYHFDSEDLKEIIDLKKQNKFNIK